MCVGIHCAYLPKVDKNSVPQNGGGIRNNIYLQTKIPRVEFLITT